MKIRIQIMTAAISVMMAAGIFKNNLAQEPDAKDEDSKQSAAVITQKVSEDDIVVVAATRIPQAIRDLGVSVSVVTRERIEQLKAQNVGEVLDEVTAARVNSYGSMGALSAITLRGSSANQVRVMVDGRPVNLPSLGMTDLSMFPLDQVERIEVIRGPGSVLYGSDALAGVVNIVTRDAPEKLRTDLSASYGSRDTRILQLANGARLGDIGYFITASQNSSDGWRENSAVDGYHVSGKLDYDMTLASRLVLSSGYSRQDKGVPGSTSWPSPNARQDDERYWFDLTHKYEFETNSHLTSKIFLNQNWQNYKDPDSFSDDVSRNQKSGLDVQQTLPLGESQLLLGGVYFENDLVNIKDNQGVSRIGGERDLFTGAGYLQDQISFSDSLVATPGLRLDIQSGYGAELSPKMSGLYRLSEDTRLKASIGRGFKAPTVNDLYWRDEFAVGNPDLSPEESIGYDVGIQQKLGTKSRLAVSLFRSDVRKLIAWNEVDGTGIWQALNVDSARLQGVETELNIQLTEEISGALNYTLLDARDTKGAYDNETLIYRPKNKLAGQLGYHSKWGLKLNLNADYTGRVFTDRANTSELGGFMTIGAGASQTIARGMEIFVNGYNLLDKDYELVKGYPMPGISVMGGLKATF